MWNIKLFLMLIKMLYFERLAADTWDHESEKRTCKSNSIIVLKYEVNIFSTISCMVRYITEKKNHCILISSDSIKTDFQQKRKHFIDSTMRNLVAKSDSLRSNLFSELWKAV